MHISEGTVSNIATQMIRFVLRTVYLFVQKYEMLVHRNGELDYRCYYYSPALKKWGCTGFACPSVTP